MKTFNSFYFTIVIMVAMLSGCSKDEETPTKEYTGIYVIDTYENVDEVYEGYIKTLSINGGTPTALKENTIGVGIAYDKKNEKIFYSDFDTSNGKIWKADVNGENAVAIVENIYDPYQIALDVNSGKVYWGDGDGNVSRSNLDGSGKEDIVTIADGLIRAIALDLAHGKLYFYDCEAENLYKADLDGKNKTVIKSGIYGYCIAVDEVNSKLYFDVLTDDDSLNGLYRSNLDGSGIEAIAENVDSYRIYGIAIDSYKSKVYWSEKSNSIIYQANLNGTNKTTISSDLVEPRGIFLKY